MAAVGYLTPGGGEGIPGPQGPPGDTGPAGPKGDTGAAGAAGPKGDTGAQGPQGNPGTPGADGADGAQGPKGDTGDTGPAGADGAQGIQGVKGDTGSQGIQGVKGDTGTAGSAGATGPAGPAGFAGFPLEEGYGFFSANIAPEMCTDASNLGGGWLTRLWVPAGKAITKAGTIVVAAGVTPGSNITGFAIYSADGLTKLGDTGNVPTLFSTTGIRSAPLTATIAAQGTGRFVLLYVSQSYTTEPTFIRNVGAAGRPELNKNLSGLRTSNRTVVAAFASTIDPAANPSATSMFCFMIG